MATTAPDSTENVSCYGAVVAFINGPDFFVTTGDTLRREKPQPDSKAVDDAPTAQVILSARSTADLHLISRQPSRQSSSTGKQPSSVGRTGSSAGRTFSHASRTPSGAVKTAWQSKGPTTEGFDNNRQVYSIDELSPLPFQPPKFYVYATSMLSGAFKVFQNMITIMVALMMVQHVIERYWSASGNTISIMEKIMMAVFLAYPMMTLLLVILSNNEITVRRFIYYRLMSLQVIVDWQNIPFYKLWFFSYFVTSFLLVNGYALYAGIITRHDKTASVFPQWTIMFMQSLLLFIFWLNMVSMEEYLVPLNKVIENSPESAKELITLCDVVQESQLKAVVKQAYRRRRAFKKLPEADQDEAARLLLQTGDSQAAFFDLNALRRTGKKREGRGGTKEDLTTIEDEYDGCFVWLHSLREVFEDLTFRKLYAWYFCLSFYDWYLMKLRRHRQARAAAGQWPYAGDVAYFHALGIIGSLCFLTVIGVEIYALWFIFFGTDMSDRDKYGILECKQCYNYISVAGETCQQATPSDKCWAAAMRGFCSVKDALGNKYGINTTQLIGLNGSACLDYRP